MIERPDIFCLQEIKATAEQLPEEIKAPSGYHAYFDSPKEKKGYSGVALYSKIKPEKVEFIMGLPHLDIEGRLIVAHYADFVLLNVYFPNGGGGPERLKYKMDFYDEFLKFIEKLRKGGKSIIFCGDINTAHEEIDLARPKENQENTGFLPEERAWLTELFDRVGWVDTFRRIHPELEAYTWWSNRGQAWAKDVGWRIDYQIATPAIAQRGHAASIYKAERFSDHAPLIIDYLD